MFLPRMLVFVGAARKKFYPLSTTRERERERKINYRLSIFYNVRSLYHKRTGSFPHLSRRNALDGKIGPLTVPKKRREKKDGIRSGWKHAGLANKKFPLISEGRRAKGLTCTSTNPERGAVNIDTPLAHPRLCGYVNVRSGGWRV